MANPRKATGRARKAPGKRAQAQVREARAEYRVEHRPIMPLVPARISSKNQITLPVAIMRALDLKPGDELDLFAYGDVLTVTKRLDPQEHIDRLYGSINIPEWRTAEDVDEYIRRERDSWDRD